MDITITINENDLANNAGIMDDLKAFIQGVSEKTAPSSPAGVMPVAPAPTMAPPVMQGQVPTVPTMAPPVMNLAPMQVMPAPTMAQPVMQNPAPNADTNTTPIPMMQNPIPTAAPTAPPAVYTLEQLSLAAAPLMDAGKTDALVALMQSFGVQTLQQLPQERYNDFAVAIRGMGAQI